MSEWAYDVIDEVAAEFSARLATEGPQCGGHWVVEISELTTERHPWFGDITGWKHLSRFIYIRNRDTAVAIGTMLAERGLIADMWQDAGGSVSRQTFAPARKTNGRRRSLTSGT